MKTLINRIEEITREKGSSIIVLKGFDTTNIPRHFKYFSFDLRFLDVVDIKELQKLVVDQVIINRKFIDDYKWMTIEEFQLFKEGLRINSMPIIILENNLYYKQFPYQNTLTDVKNIYQLLYYQEDLELDASQTALFENVSYFYGQIDYSNLSGNYFVTYPDLDDAEEGIEVIKSFQEERMKVIPTHDYPKEDITIIELSDDEISFLDLQQKILSKNDISNVLFIAATFDTLPNKYLERIYALCLITSIRVINDTIKVPRIVRVRMLNKVAL